MQRCDSSLRLNVHFHTLALDGVYVRDEGGALRFHRLPDPTHEEVVQVATWVHERLARVLARYGRSLEGADDAPSVLADGIFDVLMVLGVAPNVIRQTCLALISSYSHYYGDIPENDVFYQNQIMDHPLLWPMQLYCFNFGSTHIIHHFVVQQPFHLRQLVAKAAHAEMLRQGVRRNDFGVIRRANRWGTRARAGA